MTAPTRDSVLTVLDEWAAAAAADAAAAARADVQAQLDAATAQAAQLQAELDAAAVAAAASSSPRKPYPLTGGPAGDISKAGVLTIRDSGVVLDGWEIPAYLRTPGADVKVRNVTVLGPPNAVQTPKPPPGLIFHTGKNGTFENILTVPTVPLNGMDGFFGNGSFTLSGFEAYHVTDGLAINGDDVLVEDLDVHDLLLVAPDTANGQNRPVSHSDGVQLHSGRNVKIRRSRIRGFLAPYLGDALRRKDNPNAAGGYNVNWDIPTYALQSNGCVMVNQLAATEVDVLLEDVFLEGGIVHLNVAPNITKRGQVKTSGVVFGGHPAYPGRPVKDPNKVIVSL